MKSEPFKFGGLYMLPTTSLRSSNLILTNFASVGVLMSFSEISHDFSSSFINMDTLPPFLFGRWAAKCL